MRTFVPPWCPPLPTLPPLVGSPALRNTGWLGGFRENRGGGSRTTSYKSIASPPAVQSQPRNFYSTLSRIRYNVYTLYTVTRQTETIIKKETREAKSTWFSLIYLAAISSLLRIRERRVETGRRRRRRRSAKVEVATGRQLFNVEEIIGPAYKGGGEG